MSTTADQTRPPSADGAGGASARRRRDASYRRFAWIGLFVVLAVAFVIGGTREPSARTPDEQREERAQNIAESVMCPTCRGQAVSDSDASAARGIRTYIDRRVGEDASDDEIRNELADRYGDDILLTPGRSGWSGLVWSLPVIALVVALAGIGFAFHRWRNRAVVEASAADTALVEKALDDLTATSSGAPKR